MKKRKKGYLSISSVAHMFSIHQQTIRLYEKEGLIAPKRSEGNTRLFSEDDINKLEHIIYLTHELGINLAGVQMILKLKKQIKRLQTQINKVLDETQESLNEKALISKTQAETSAQKLLDIKKESASSDDDHPHKLESWEIEYEEE